MTRWYAPILPARQTRKSTCKVNGDSCSSNCVTQSILQQEAFRVTSDSINGFVVNVHSNLTEFATMSQSRTGSFNKRKGENVGESTNNRRIEESTIVQFKPQSKTTKNQWQSSQGLSVQHHCHMSKSTMQQARIVFFSKVRSNLMTFWTVCSTPMARLRTCLVFSSKYSLAGSNLQARCHKCACQCLHSI